MLDTLHEDLDMFHTVSSEIFSVTVQRTHFNAFMTALLLFVTLLTVTHVNNM
jgi:hypothetical protein